MTTTTPAPRAAAHLNALTATIELRAWELLLAPAASGGWLASLAGPGLHHPLRASGPTAVVALDELARLVADKAIEEEADAAPPEPTEVFMVRFQSDEGRMIGITCADLVEARSLARARDGHIVRRATEVVM